MKAKLAKLIDVKSIMTLLLTVVFCALAWRGVIGGKEFQTIFTVIVGFYFGTQSQKKTDINAASYIGPQQGVVVADGMEPIREAVDAAAANDAHPPDGVVAQVGFEY